MTVLQINPRKFYKNTLKKDPRIVVINQEQAGQYAARNMAIGIAKGEYIGFLDADDYIFRGFILRMRNSHTQ